MHGAGPGAPRGPLPTRVRVSRPNPLRPFAPVRPTRGRRLARRREQFTPTRRRRRRAFTRADVAATVRPSRSPTHPRAALALSTAATVWRAAQLCVSAASPGREPRDDDAHPRPLVIHVIGVEKELDQAETIAEMIRRLGVGTTREVRRCGSWDPRRSAKEENPRTRTVLARIATLRMTRTVAVRNARVAMTIHILGLSFVRVVGCTTTSRRRRRARGRDADGTGVARRRAQRGRGGVRIVGADGSSSRAR